MTFPFPFFSAGGGVDYVSENSGVCIATSELALTYSITAPWTLSAWVQFADAVSELPILGGTGGEIHRNANGTLEVEGVSSTALLIDPTAWGHLHVSDNGVYWNGEEIIAGASVTTTDLTNTKLLDGFLGYAQEIHLQSGTNAVTNFGSLVGNEWVMIDTLAQAGEHYIKDPSTGVNSGSGSNWTPSNISQSNNSATDNAAGTVGCFAMMNPLNTASAIGLNAGNTAINSDNSTRAAPSTLALPSGVGIYFEGAPLDANGASNGGLGIGTDAFNYQSATDNRTSAEMWFARFAGSFYHNNATALATFTAVTTSDRLQIAFKDGDLWIGRNGTWISGDPAAGTSPSATGISATSLFAAICTQGSGQSKVYFRDGDWSYTVPTGFKSFNTANLPTGGTVSSGTNSAGAFVYTGGSLVSVTWNSVEYVKGVHDGSVIKFYATGFQPQAGAGSSIAWTAVIETEVSDQPRSEIN